MTSKIEWTNKTWNPITGCTKISPGCTNCYAERMARRLAGRHGYPPAPHHFDVTLHPDKLELPLRWKKPRMIFVCSMSDLFHENVPDTFIRDVFNRMCRASWHTFQVLTKRPKRMLSFVLSISARIHGSDIFLPLSNVWLGVSVENQASADERIPILLQTPSAVRFVSCEPLLEAIDLAPCLGFVPTKLWPTLTRDEAKQWIDERNWLDWVIVGGESGPGARPMNPTWARNIRDQCQAADVPFFFKQWGAWYPNDASHPGFAEMKTDARHIIVDDMAFARVGKKRAGRLLGGRTWNEMPIPNT